MEVAEGKRGPKKLEMAARKLVDVAMTGDVSAMREMGDRLDGKATQAIEATINDQRMVAELPPTAKDTAEWAGRHGPH